MDIINYEAPSVELDHVETTVALNPVAVWAIVVGVYVVSLAYAAYCRASGGWADISFSWRGFRVTCYR